MATKEDPMLREHRKTFEGFARFIVYSTATIVLVLVLLAIFLL